MLCCLTHCVVYNLVCCDTNLRHVVNFIISMGLHLGKSQGGDVERAGDLVLTEGLHQVGLQGKNVSVAGYGDCV